MAPQRDGATHKRLLSLVPRGPEWSIDWEEIQGILPAAFAAMTECPQDPNYHGEGNVLIHTRMVVESLVVDPEWRDLQEAPEDPFGLTDDDRRSMLFWAAVLHDIGKPECTVLDEDGRYTSKGHSRIGAQMARRFLWKAGSPFHWREALCGIIQAHQVPFWLLERENAERLSVELSYNCNTQDLCLHAKHDALGRICEDQTAILESVELARMHFADLACLGRSRKFSNDASRIEFLKRDDRYIDYVAHEDYTCEVIMMSGLPGAGKDTWISKCTADFPVVSLDAIRIEMGIKPTGNQGAVIQEARERAREHLRAGQDFVWNATNITRNMRDPILSLFREYGARTRIVYVEADHDSHLRQNAARQASVPEAVIQKLLRKLEPPTRGDAHDVEFVVPTARARG